MKNRILATIMGLLLMLPAGAATYGPVASGETLWNIASRTRPSYDVSTQQMMLSIRMKNPRAFSSKNINSLKRGAVLQLPTLVEIQRLNRVQAIRTTRIHNTNWRATHKTAGVSKASLRANLSRARKTEAQLRREVSTLRKQLAQEKQHSKQLTSQIRKLEEDGNNKTVKSGTAPDIGKLQAELTDLKSVLTDKDNHIKNLQSSLKEASEAIKRQHAENLALYEQIKSAESTAPEESPKPAPGKGELTLAGVGEEQPPMTIDGKPAVFTDQLTGQQPAKPAGQESSKNGVPLKELLDSSAAKSAGESKTGQAIGLGGDSDSKSAGGFKGPSKVSFIIALISLLFILALLWRAFSQQRATKRALEAARKQDE